MQKELVLQFPKRKLSHSIQSAIMHSQSHRGYHNASLLPSPQFSLSDAPFLAAPRRWSASSSTHWGKIWLGTGPGPYLIRWPLLVSWSVPPMSPTGARLSRESEHQSERELGIPSGGTPPCLSRDSFAPARPRHQSSSSRGWHGWGISLEPQEMLQKLVLKKPSTTLGELENSGLLC